MNERRIYLWQWLFDWLLTAAWVGVVALPVLGLRWLAKDCSEWVPSLVVTVLGLGYLVYFPVTLYLLIATIHYLNEDPGVSFHEALKSGVASLRLLLSFIPVIGVFFERHEDAGHSDPQDE